MFRPAAISLSAFQNTSSRATLVLRPAIVMALLTTADLRLARLDGEILPMAARYRHVRRSKMTQKRRSQARKPRAARICGPVITRSLSCFWPELYANTVPSVIGGPHEAGSLPDRLSHGLVAADRVA